MLNLENINKRLVLINSKIEFTDNKLTLSTNKDEYDKFLFSGGDGIA